MTADLLPAGLEHGSGLEEQSCDPLTRREAEGKGSDSDGVHLCINSPMINAVMP